MSNKSSLAIGAILLSGCNPVGNSEPKPVSGLELTAAVTDAKTYLGDGGRIVAVCGGSEGKSLYLDRYDEGYSSDGIGGGIIALGFDAKGDPEIVHRDASKEMTVMGEPPDGAEITFLADPEDGRLGVWVAVFPRSRVVEVHNLTIGPDGQLFDLWTSNKPRNIISARSMSFHSKCEFVL